MLVEDYAMVYICIIVCATLFGLVEYSSDVYAVKCSSVSMSFQKTV